MTPDELAHELGISSKALRSWLRAERPRSMLEKHQRWHLDAATAQAAHEHFASGPTERPIEMAGDAAGITEQSGFESLLDAFRSARLYRRSQVLATPCPVPAGPGVYGWWFRRPPAAIDTSKCLSRQGLTLLYAGISPRRPPTSGRPPSRQTLRDRITYHYSGNAEGSTLRKTLGVLLAEELGIDLRRVGGGARMTFGLGERVLSAWMEENALVSWIVHPKPWIAEAQLIARLDVPLNLDGNLGNPFHPSLAAARGRAVDRARKLPVMPNPGVGGR